ncbi:MAG: type II toxin-antitoxin system RelE/ParE family toxin [Magnetococcales bacterium]|nr:type II toxin-antitoxin system RelE/ParE family toxin [Magnetococcales bacterium]
MTVVETHEFQAQAKKLLGQEEVLALINHLSRNPTDGDLIEGTGGVRKLRWRRPGTGKRGGYRIIHFFHDHATPLFLFTIYQKNAQDNLSGAQRIQLRKMTKKIVAAYHSGVKSHVRNS